MRAFASAVVLLLVSFTIVAVAMAFAAALW